LAVDWAPSFTFWAPAAAARVDDTDLAVGDLAEYAVFYEGSGGALYHATQERATVEVELIDAAPGLDVGAFCSLGLDRQTGRLHVAYYDATRKDLRYARKDPGGPWVRRVIEAIGDVGSHAA